MVPAIAAQLVFKKFRLVRFILSGFTVSKATQVTILM